MKKVIRTCVACGAKKEKHELTRFTLNGQPLEDASKRADGRGAYVCDNDKCRDTAFKKNRLTRSLQRKTK